MPPKRKCSKRSKSSQTTIVYGDSSPSTSLDDIPAIDQAAIAFPQPVVTADHQRQQTASGDISTDAVYLQKQARHARNILMKQLFSLCRNPDLVALEEPFIKVYDLLERTITNGESNSAILIGPRSSGKTSIINKALDRLYKTYNLADDNTMNNGITKKYFVVRLNGHIHTNDNIALRDIARQLSIEQSMEEFNVGSFAQAMMYLLEVLKKGNRGTSPVLFLLDEFDLLAQHPKQTLLYTLFDIAQSHQSPVAVIGITPRLDVLDLLEKRVKSRYSHRQIYVHFIGNMEGYVEVAKQLLLLSDDNSEVLRLDPAYRSQFNYHVEELFNDQDFVNILSSLFNLGKDIRFMTRVFVSTEGNDHTLPIGKLGIEQPYLTAELFATSYKKQREDGKMSIAKDVSLLEISLVIAMKDLIHNGYTKFNFEMVYETYKRFMSQNITSVSVGGSLKMYKKPVALKAFESLVEMELVKPTDGFTAGGDVSTGDNSTVVASFGLIAGNTQASRCPKEFRMVQMMFEPCQVVELVQGRDDLPMVIKRWAMASA
ncbi:origin recognition complex subunit 4 [Mycoemilia scoparia]|uniref:Origin recognition complex subunit 4 n=1 Tax=Mycoemilia scoparia TaxID=417184 RepID=A0A9W8DUS0_9FUNG|nr:origin recognition complex subunit 4 [Mycoemilia scoparia]